MEKVTKKDLARKLQRQESRIDRLVEKLARKGLYDDEQEQADHDEVLIILDSKEPKLKQLDQSVFDGLDAKWRFAAVDSNGDLEAYLSEPELCSDHFYDVSRKRIGEGYDTTDWQNSLIERKELTGSDLCRAMLERGDKFVMCANQSAYDDWPRAIALNERGRMYYISGEYSYDANDSIYPINNQGEPLTAAEAGL